MVRVTVGVEAHTHEFIATAHEDQKFGFSLAGGAAFEAAARILDEDVLELRGLHSHIGSQIFDTSGFEVSRPAGARAAGADPRRSAASSCPSWTSAAASASRTPPRTTRRPPADLAKRMIKIVERRVRRPARCAVPHLSIEPGRAIVGPAMFTLYEVGTVKDVDGIRTYVSVDGGMSDNIRTALYDASYSATLAGRARRRPSRCSPAWWESIASPGTSS